MDNIEEENVVLPRNNSSIINSAPYLETYANDKEKPQAPREASINTTRQSKAKRDMSLGTDGMKLPPLPAAIARSRGEKKAHAVYRRIVKAYQNKQATFMARVVLAVMVLVVSIDLVFVVVQEILVGVSGFRLYRYRCNIL